ncbi:transporter substrate-binding domain-containing protein [Pigmentibacter sp. JX0631]|uniref:transporter substrate-binding domain-containing protein n=1 Tax=Pigmentibacter sp. JX0631 TaxID=2976982 RepID=UPI002468A689|nr:transporter substrate-binding domain-containing protein [Pigmentibacter sp. JX0631]WGL59590.1 transporter substrate-binding domain-containing protein [Pigmentibacter sp. JX0631]
MRSSTNSGLRLAARSTLIKLFICAISTVILSKGIAAEKSILDTIKKDGVLRVCAESGYLPLEMKTASGKWLGFDPEMMEAYAKSLNVKLLMLDTKWDGIIPSLLTAKCDMIASSMAKTKERAKAVQFSDPYYDNKLLIATKDTPENRKLYKSLDDFNKPGLKVAVKTGSAPDLYLQDSKALNKAQIMRFDADADTLNAVIGGRALAFIYDTPYVKLAALNNPGKIYIVPSGFSGDQFAVAMRKKDQDLHSSFNKFLADWKKNGGYAKAVKYYFEGQEWMALLDK